MEGEVAEPVREQRREEKTAAVDCDGEVVGLVGWWGGVEGGKNRIRAWVMQAQQRAEPYNHSILNEIDLHHKHGVLMLKGAMRKLLNIGRISSKSRKCMEKPLSRISS